jgi:hypothetical protein
LHKVVVKNLHIGKAFNLFQGGKTFNLFQGGKALNLFQGGKALNLFQGGEARFVLFSVVKFYI